MNARRGRGRQRAMPQNGEFGAARILARSRGGEDFLRFHIEEAEPHRAMAHDAFEVPQATAAAEFFVRIESHDDVAAFPDAVCCRIASEADSVPESPHPNQIVELAVRGRDSRGHHVGVIRNRDFRLDPALGQCGAHRGLHGEALELLQIRRIFNYAFSDDTGHRKADRFQRLALGQSAPLPSAGYLAIGPTTLCPSTTPKATCSLSTTPMLRGIFSPLEPRQLVQAVKCRGLVALGKSRIVENGIDKVVDGSLEDHDRLPDVEQFARAFADDVHAEHFPGLTMEDELQPPGGVAANLTARDLAIIGDADLVGHVLIGKLLLGLAGERDFGNRVDAIRIRRRIRMNRLVIRVRRGDAALLHRNGGEAGEADDVAYGENVRLFGAILPVHRNAPAAIGLDTGRREIQLVHIALPAHRVQQRVARKLCSPDSRRPCRPAYLRRSTLLRSISV